MGKAGTVFLVPFYSRVSANRTQVWCSCSLCHSPYPRQEHPAPSASSLTVGGVIDEGTALPPTPEPPPAS